MSLKRICCHGAAKFMLAGLIPHRNQWAKRKGGQRRPPSSRTIVIALDNLELYYFRKGQVGNIQFSGETNKSERLHHI